MKRRSKIRLPGYRWRVLLLITAVVLLGTGCAATPAEPPQPLPRTTETQQDRPPAPPLSVRLRTEVAKWDGTPHRMGGTSRKGVDCSGFVQRIYLDLFGLQLPRTTTLQVRSGLPVPKNRLTPGDLVFFNPPYKKNHVGIYLGEDRFAHASTSKGVTISTLSDTYWRKSYWTARRYLD